MYVKFTCNRMQWRHKNLEKEIKIDMNMYSLQISYCVVNFF